ncbi:MAG: siroheme synthase [Alphaproteobacteria bacterium BRH_c36]|nr:MAG: siroheme synthase [Alphaproteobacteria bacterium BRH_c36]
MPTASRKPAEKLPPRMGALAKLPVFFNLAGKRAVLAGGTAAAAWKAELIAATGAHVEIYATELEIEMAALIERGAASGTITHHPRPWAIDIFGGAGIALADAETEAQAQAFYCAAVAAGVPVNVIDKPAYCQFQFGSIVNRSPVVVSISTDGAAPILGQAIRRRIETLLPPALAVWGELAKDIRAAVSARLSPGPQRRAFWERFSDRAFGKAPDAADRSSATALIDDIANGTDAATGKVTLVGAGPGDPELLTLKAVRALQSADVILFDDLVSDEILELARREAKRMLVGKRGGRESCQQTDINTVMIKLAKQGKHVVRLKSGDPMIFGRAGEEIDRLEKEGIAVAVVPGISSGIAMASELGVSLTHRDRAHSVRFVTGHARNGKLPDDIDWKGLADPETTLIFYMAGRTSAEIAERLIMEGLPPHTPVVVAAAVSRANSRRLHTTLAGLRTADIPNRLSGPILLGIGAIFSSREPTADQMDGTIRRSA